MSIFTVTEKGVITTDTSSVRGDFEQAYMTALGANLNTDISTPVGQMIANDTSMLTTAQQECVAMANENNVYYATGQALDVAASFYGYFRKQGVPTTVVATLTGSSGTAIPAGSVVSDGTNQYTILGPTVIPATGSVSAEFQCQTPGPIECPAGTLTTIVTQVSGWDSVTNPTDGITGYTTENDNTFRDRITANYLNKRARAILGAIIDNVAAINNVISVVGGENPTGQTATVNGVSLPAHSIYLTVLGGNDADIAKVIAQQKTMGADTVGNTQVAYTDPSIGYQYVYSIYRPTVVPIYVQVQYTPNVYTPANADTQIMGLIAEYVQNNPFTIGQTVSGNTLAVALAEYNKVDLLAIKVSTDNSTWQDYITVGQTQVAVLTTGGTSTIQE